MQDVYRVVRSGRGREGTQNPAKSAKHLWNRKAVVDDEK
jgi:hypothetical protein